MIATVNRTTFGRRNTWSVKDKIRWHIQDFPESTTPKGRQPTIWPFFSKTCMKMKTFWPGGGVPLDPPMKSHVTPVHFMFRVCMPYWGWMLDLILYKDKYCYCHFSHTSFEQYWLGNFLSKIDISETFSVLSSYDLDYDFVWTWSFFCRVQFYQKVAPKCSSTKCCRASVFVAVNGFEFTVTCRYCNYRITEQQEETSQSEEFSSLKFLLLDFVFPAKPISE